MRNASRLFIIALVALSVGAALTPSETVAAESQHEGPWFKAKVGTMVRYRVTPPEAMPGKTPKSAVITEEVVATTPETVTVKMTRQAPGEADRVNTVTRPRRISGDQYGQFLSTIGYDRKGVEIKNSGLTFSCRLHEREFESSSGDPDHTVKVRTVFCRELPGWFASQRAYAVSWKNDEVRFELLEVKP